MNTTRTGKIARLPEVIREELNRRPADGATGKKLVAWPNGLPQVQEILASKLGGRAVREQNLSDWRHGGYADWHWQQEMLERLPYLSAKTDVAEIGEESLRDKLSLWLSARCLVGCRQLAQAKGKLDLARLRELCSDVLALRRGDQRAERLRMEQEDLKRERGESGEEVLARFDR